MRLRISVKKTNYLQTKQGLNLLEKIFRQVIKKGKKGTLGTVKMNKCHL